MIKYENKMIKYILKFINKLKQVRRKTIMLFFCFVFFQIVANCLIGA